MCERERVYVCVEVGGGVSVFFYVENLYEDSLYPYHQYAEIHEASALG